jgi:hypothetical protein
MAAYYGATTLPQGTATPALANPEDGAVAVGKFQSEYFGLTLPLPHGWIAGAAGPPPSQFGDYVLGTLVPGGENVGAIVMTAQDMFFGTAPYADAAAMIDREPSEERIGGRVLWRVDFSGVGLYRAMLVTEIRCHLVRFNLTAREPLSLESLLRSIDNLSFDAKSDAGESNPICIKDYATGETIVKKVQPIPVGPTYAPIPVRIIIGADGEVKSIHVMHATVDQRHSIEGAVRQWKFKPYVMKGRAVDVETGLGFRFTLSRS